MDAIQNKLNRPKIYNRSVQSLIICFIIAFGISVCSNNSTENAVSEEANSSNIENFTTLSEKAVPGNEILPKSGHGFEESVVQVPIQMSVEKIQTLLNGSIPYTVTGTAGVSVGLELNKLENIYEYITHPATAAVYGTRQIPVVNQVYKITLIYYPCPTYTNPLKVCSYTVGEWVEETTYITETYLITPAVPEWVEEILVGTNLLSQVFDVNVDVNYAVTFESLTLTTGTNGGTDGCELKTDLKVNSQVSFSYDDSSLPEGWFLKDYQAALTETEAVLDVSTSGIASFNENTVISYTNNSLDVNIIKQYDPLAIDILGKTPFSLLNYINCPLSDIVLQVNWSIWAEDYVNKKLNDNLSEKFETLKPMINTMVNEKMKEFIPFTLVDTSILDEQTYAWLTAYTDDDNKTKLTAYMSQLQAEKDEDDKDIISTSIGIGGRPVFVMSQDPNDKPPTPAEVDTTYKLVEPNNDFTIAVAGRVQLDLIEDVLNAAWEKYGYTGDIPVDTFLPYVEILNDSSLKELLFEYAEADIDLDLLGWGIPVYFNTEVNGVIANVKVNSIGFSNGFMISDGFIYFWFGSTGKTFGGGGEDSNINLSTIEI